MNETGAAGRDERSARRGPADWEEPFDALVDLAPEEQAARLVELAAVSPELAERLRVLLAADTPAADFLAGSAAAAVGLAEGMPADADAVVLGELPAGTRLGAWRLLAPIGRGGMGDVYLACRADGTYEQKVAVKLVQAGAGGRSILRRFLREREILAQLDHPNIARLLDGGSAPDGRPYFVLEWVDGVPVTEFCSRERLSLEATLKLVGTICDAVDSAHRRLVVHRDLKPANILVTAEGTVKLLDFGIAKLLSPQPGEGSTMTHLEARALTPAYASPEQILGEPITVSSDVYALGLLLYELLVGTLPHRRSGRSLAAIASELPRETIERPSAALRRAFAEGRAIRSGGLIPARIDADLDLIVLTALQREPARRYRSAAELADELRSFLAGRPIRARPDGLAYRLRMAVRRHRLVFAAGSSGLVALFAGLALALFQAHEARLEARRADAASARAARVQSFLVSVFRESDPDLAPGEDPRASEMLSSGAERLERDLAGDPEVRADLLEAIARIEINLGYASEAERHARRALDARRLRHPMEQGKIAIGEVVLARAANAAGEVDVSRTLCRFALPRLKEAYGFDSLEVAQAERAYAATLREVSEEELILGLLDHSLAVHQRILGRDHEESAATLAELGQAFEQAQRYPEAETAYLQSIELLERRLGNAHPRVAVALVNLASLLDRLSRVDEAKVLFTRAISIERTALGPRHERLAESLFSFGILELGAQRYDSAEAAFKEALDIWGPYRYEAGHCLRYLGLAAAARERFAEAGELFEQAAETFRREQGAGEMQLHRALANVGWARLRLGRTSEAIVLLSDAVANIERLGGPKRNELRLPLRQLGEALTLGGRATEAVATLERVRALEEELYGKRNPREVGGIDLLLARALLARGRPGDRAAARTCLDEGIVVLGRAPAPETLLGQSLVERGRMALHDGRRDAARADLAAAVPILEAKRGAAHAETVTAKRLLLQSKRGPSGQA